MQLQKSITRLLTMYFASVFERPCIYKLFARVIFEEKNQFQFQFFFQISIKTLQLQLNDMTNNVPEVI